MRTSDKGIVALISHEGVVPGPYRDSKGILTYGVGHTKAAGEPIPANMAPGMPENLDGALMRVFEVFRSDLEKYEAEVSRAIKIKVSQHEFDAAVSFHFNTGAIHRAAWVRTLNSGDRNKAASEIMNWSKPREIIKRRAAEQTLFVSGTYPTDPITVWGVTNDKRVIWKPARVLSSHEALSLMRGTAKPDVHTEEPPEAPWWVRLLSIFMRSK